MANVVLALVLLLLVATVVATGLWWTRKSPLRIGALSGTDPALTAIGRRVSTRLDIRFVEPGDLDFYINMATDQDAAEANGWADNETAAIRQRFANRAEFRQFRATELVAIERATKTPVATATLTLDSATRPGTNTVGIHVHPDHRRLGYGREIMSAAILLLQQSHDDIYVGTRISNVGLQHVMTSLGYAPEPETHAYVAPNGETYESLWYCCGKSEGQPQL